MFQKAGQPAFVCIKKHIKHFLSKRAKEKGEPTKRLDASAVKLLTLHDWPGNIRELKDVVLLAAYKVAKSSQHPIRL